MKGWTTAQRQEAILGLLAKPFHGGTATEFELVDSLWPIVRNPRRTIRAMEAKGLLRVGDYINEESGYEVNLPPTPDKESPDA